MIKVEPFYNEGIVYLAKEIEDFIKKNKIKSDDIIALQYSNNTLNEALLMYKQEEMYYNY